MSTGDSDARGRLDDEAEEREPSSTKDGAAAEGRYDPAQGSPSHHHPIGEAYPDEAVSYDDPEARPRSDGGSDAG